MIDEQVFEWIIVIGIVVHCITYIAEVMANQYRVERLREIKNVLSKWQDLMEKERRNGR